MVTIVDAERFWSSWNSLSTMQDDPMGDAPDDEDARSHVSMFAEQIEAAGMVVVAGTQTEVGAKAAESICTAVRALNPAGVIVNLEAVAADAVMAAPGRDHFLMLGGGWTPGQGSQDDAGVTWMRQRDDVDPADATAAMAPAVGGGFVYTRRTPFHPTRFHDWCERYFFTQAAQHEHGTAASTSLWTFLDAFSSSPPPQSRRSAYSSLCPCSLDADWYLQSNVL